MLVGSGVSGDLALAIATFSGGAFAVVFQFMLGWFRRRGDAVVNDQAEFRKELWTEIGHLRGKVERMSKELDDTRIAYAELLTRHGALTAEHTALERDHKLLTAKYDALRAEFAALRGASIQELATLRGAQTAAATGQD